MLYPPLNCLSELDRAINRLDFYRLFKALCVEFDVELLTLFDMNNWPDEEAIDSLMVVINSQESINIDLEAVVIPPENSIFLELRNSIMSRCWSPEQVDEDISFTQEVSSKNGLSVPLHTPNGRHFGFWIMLNDEAMEKQDLCLLINACKIVFERFFKEILLPVSFPILSPRELEVIRWSSEGKTSVEIAIILGLSEHTINSYTTKILQKLQVVNRAQMVASAIRMGLIQ